MTSFPQLVGILNLAPDSFSDGGQFTDPEAAIAHADTLTSQSASVIDIGAESTRPGAAPITPEEEWDRLLPMLTRLMKNRPAAAISIDTRHPRTAARALALGVDWINDVGGLAQPEMLAVVANSSCRLVMMHSLTIPADPSQTLPADSNPLEEILAWAHTRLAILEQHGITRDRIIVDPGIGFGKTAPQSWALIQSVDRLHELGLPILIGHSRKSFLKQLGDAPAASRDEQTLAVSLFLLEKNISYLRVHDVALHRQMFDKLHPLLSPKPQSHTDA